MKRAIRRTWNRLIGSLLGQRREGELAEELEAHISLLADDLVVRGVPPEEARRRARLEFGSVEAAKEGYRDQRGLPFLDTLFQDVNYALRGFRRNPGFAMVAILSLAIGIGANTAVFSLVNSVLLQPLAFHDPQRLYMARELHPRFAALEAIPVNPMHALEWAEQCPSLETVAVMRSNAGDVGSGGEPESIRGADVPHNLFALFGVEPILGRAFLPEEELEGNDRVVILSESLWRSRFNADRSLVGNPSGSTARTTRWWGLCPRGSGFPTGWSETSTCASNSSGPSS